MLWRVSIDDGDVFSQQLAFKSPAPPTFPTELNNPEGHTRNGFFFLAPVFLFGVCVSKSKSEAERRVGEVQRDRGISRLLACQDSKGIAFSLLSMI